MGRQADVSTTAKEDGDHPPKRSMFSSILARFRRAEARPPRPRLSSSCCLLSSPHCTGRITTRP